jgi:phosphoheptose isomerase
MKFPNKKSKNFKDFLNLYKIEATKMFNEDHVEKLKKITNMLSKAYNSKKTIFVCGNGGSAAIAEHFVCDHQKLLDTTKKYKPRVTSLSSNLPLITALANDVSYSKIFSEQLRYNFLPGDILFVISASGNSPNIIEALKFANKNQISTISFTGFNGGKAKKISNINIHCKSFNYGIVEMMHHNYMNIVAQYLRQKVLSTSELKKTFF